MSWRGGGRDGVGRILSRRQFLKLVARAGLTLTLASALPLRTVQAIDLPPLSRQLNSDLLDDPEVRQLIIVGFGPLFVAGRFLNTFSHNLRFENLPRELQLKYRWAGAEWKSWPAAQAIYRTVPYSVRIGGPDALWKFHQTKDWSHIVPKSMGGPTTAQNGVWWTAGQNRSLGPNPMTDADIANAKALLSNQAIRAAIAQTMPAMAKAGLVGVVIGATFGCLELGLQYANDEITREEMLEGIVQWSVFAGISGFVITGLILGLSLAFPFLIPVILPALYILQGVAIVFLGPRALELAKGWFDVLNRQGLLGDLNDVLGTVRTTLIQAYEGVHNNILSVILGWVEWLAGLIGRDRAWRSLGEQFQRLGFEQALEWVAARTQFVERKAQEIVDSLNGWDVDLPEVDVDIAGMKQLIGQVVVSEFEGAISTTEAMQESISKYHKSATLKVTHPPAIVSLGL